MLATLVDAPFDDPGWVFETKWDGFRMIAKVANGRATLYSRGGKNVTGAYPSIAAAISKVRPSAVLDGELVALDRRGRSRFQLLQNALRSRVPLRYCLFDLMFLDGADLRTHTLIERKHKLRALLPQEPPASFQPARPEVRQELLQQRAASRARGNHRQARR